jgi:hypothetical protein
MTLGSKEHYDVMGLYERRFKVPPAREAKEYWSRGIIYCNGKINIE